MYPRAFQIVRAALAPFSARPQVARDPSRFDPAFRWPPEPGGDWPGDLVPPPGGGRCKEPKAELLREAEG